MIYLKSKNPNSISNKVKKDYSNNNKSANIIQMPSKSKYKDIFISSGAER